VNEKRREGAFDSKAPSRTHPKTHPGKCGFASNRQFPREREGKMKYAKGAFFSEKESPFYVQLPKINPVKCMIPSLQRSTRAAGKKQSKLQF